MHFSSTAYWLERKIENIKKSRKSCNNIRQILYLWFMKTLHIVTAGTYRIINSNILKYLLLCCTVQYRPVEQSSRRREMCTGAYNCWNRRQLELTFHSRCVCERLWSSRFVSRESRRVVSRHVCAAFAFACISMQRSLLVASRKYGAQATREKCNARALRQ